MRSIHRWLTTIFAVVLGFIAITGLAIEAVDLYVLYGFSSHPETELGSINGGRQFLDPKFVSLGPGIPWPDAGQTALGADPSPLLARVLPGLNTLAPNSPISSAVWTSVGQAPLFAFNFADGHAGLTVNGLTGAMIRPSSAAGGATPPPPGGGGLGMHDFIKSFHAGRVAAAPGMWLIFSTGSSLLLLSFTGLWVYARMGLQRRALGRSDLFWSGRREPLLWRRLHRHVSLLAAGFLAYMATTGTLLSLDDIVVSHSPIYDLLRTPLPFELGRTPQIPIVRADLLAQFSRVRAAAARAAPGRNVLSITLTASQDAQAIIARPPRAVVYLFNPATGDWTNRSDPAITSESPYGGSMRYHSLLQELHTGAVIGLGGRWLIVLAGASLLYLAISGMVMYFQMLGRRRKVGAKAWFWA